MKVEINRLYCIVLFLENEKFMLAENMESSRSLARQREGKAFCHELRKLNYDAIDNHVPTKMCRFCCKKFAAELHT